MGYQSYNETDNCDELVHVTKMAGTNFAYTTDVYVFRYGAGGMKLIFKDVKEPFRVRITDGVTKITRANHNVEEFSSADIIGHRYDNREGNLEIDVTDDAGTTHIVKMSCTPELCKEILMHMVGVGRFTNQNP